MDTTLPTGPRGRLLAVALLVAVLGVGWAAIAQPLLAWHADAAERLEQRQALARRMAAAAAGLDALKQAGQAQASRPGPARSLLDGGSDAVAAAALQGQAETLALREHLTLASAEVLPSEPAGDYRRISLRLVLNGSWPALVGLLKSLEEANPRILVDDVQMQPLNSVDTTAGQVLSASFTVIAFRSGKAG